MKEDITVYRTKERTIFEVAFLILALVVWGLIIWFVKPKSVVRLNFSHF